MKNLKFLMLLFATIFSISAMAQDPAAPGMVTNVSVDTNKGEGPLTIKFTSPTVDETGAPLDRSGITNIKVSSYNQNTGNYDPVMTITGDQLELGKEYTFVNSSTVKGTLYGYTITSELVIGRDVIPSSPVRINVSVMKDKPGQAEDVLAKAMADGVLITWKAPTIGAEMGWIDPAAVKFNIYRSVAGTETLVGTTAEGATSYTDSEIPADVKEVKYIVESVNAIGVGERAQSNSLKVNSTTSSLPYIEGFDTPKGWAFTTDHDDWTILSGNNWGASATIACADYTSTAATADGEGGLGRFAFGKWSTDLIEDVVTGPISLDGAENPALDVDFWYFVNPEKTYDSTLDFRVAVDGTDNYVSVLKLSQADAQEVGWKTFTASLADFKDKTIRIMLHAESGSVPQKLPIDNLKVYDSQTSGIKSVGTKSANTNSFNLNGQRIGTTSAARLVVVGNKKILVR